MVVPREWLRQLRDSKRDVEGNPASRSLGFGAPESMWWRVGGEDHRGGLYSEDLDCRV